MAWEALSALAGVHTAVRFWYNPSLSSKRFYGPGILVMAISMFPPLLATLAMAREGERKTILQVYVSNISAHEFLLGKIVAFMIVALAEAVLLLIYLFSYFDTNGTRNVPVASTSSVATSSVVVGRIESPAPLELPSNAPG